jgi:hypothetical protein
MDNAKRFCLSFLFDERNFAGWSIVFASAIYNRPLDVIGFCGAGHRQPLISGT